MKIFLKLSIGKRLGGSFGILLFLILLVGVIGINGMNELYGKVNSIVLYNNTKMAFAGEMNISIGQRENGILSLLLATNNEQKQEIVEKIKWQATQYDEAKKGLAELLAVSGATEQETNIVAKIDEAEAAVSLLFAKAMDLSVANKNGEALKVWDEQVKPVLRDWITDVRELVSVEQHLNEDAAVETEMSYGWARKLVLGFAVLAIVLGAFLAYSITRSITRPLNDAIGIAKRVADGDLTQNIAVKSRDETGQLLQALKDMNDSLASIVTDVRRSTDVITTASREVATGNADLSQRTEEQASSLEETASNMEELTSTVKQNAENAKQANQLAANASDVAVKGGLVVNEVVNTMASISASSKKIVDIISVIEGIAFQTNILALNAAVEAARAGEQGRGFAVVASEVRNLAQRSAAAAKEIKTLIGDSVDKVDAGSKQVDQAGATMNEIVAAVKRVTDIMTEIAAASNEQSSGIEQVNQAIVQMDEVTQQNAALVEQAAAAAEAMQEQAKGLYEAMSIFKLGEVKGGLRTTAAKPAIASPAAVEPLMGEKRLSGHPKERRLTKAREDNEKHLSAHPKDGEWKEF